MNLKLKRIAPLQAGKMLAAFYGLISLIIVPMMLVFMAVGGLAAANQGTGGGPATVPLMMGMGLGFMLLLPLMYALMGFVGGFVGALIYNLMTKWIGGFEFEFEPVAPPSV